MTNPRIAKLLSLDRTLTTPALDKANPIAYYSEPIHDHASTQKLAPYAFASHFSTSSFSSTGSMLSTCATPLRPPFLLLLMSEATS